MLLENGALYFDARSLYGRAYGPKGRHWLWPSVRDASGYQAMWSDFLGPSRAAARTELTLEQLFADFAYLDAAYRSKASGRPETPKQPPTV